MAQRLNVPLLSLKPNFEKERVATKIVCVMGASGYIALLEKYILHIILVGLIFKCQ